MKSVRTSLRPGHFLRTFLTFWSALRASGGCSFVDAKADATAGCEAYAAGACQAYARCSATFLASYGSLEACVDKLGGLCAFSLMQPDVLGSGAGAATCGEQMLGADCD